MKVLLAGAVLLSLGITAATVAPPRGAPDTSPGDFAVSGTGVRHQIELLQRNTLESGSAPDTDDARKAMDMARRYLGDHMRKLLIVGRSAMGEYLLEDGAGFCLAVRTGYWPEVSERSVKPSGRFAATQALGLGC